VNLTFDQFHLFTSNYFATKSDILELITAGGGGEGIMLKRKIH